MRKDWPVKGTQRFLPTGLLTAFVKDLHPAPVWGARISLTAFARQSTDALATSLNSTRLNFRTLRHRQGCRIQAAGPGRATEDPGPRVEHPAAAHLQLFDHHAVSLFVDRRLAVG